MKKTEYHSIRKDFQKSGLDTSTCPDNPVKLLDVWLNDAIISKQCEPTSMILSTVDQRNRPSSRVVLLKALDQLGLRFFTNYQSKKALDLDSNNNASILFFWADLERQVRIEGRVEKTNDKVSEEYFHSRPKDSQINAIISPQSQIIPDREFLLNRREDLVNKLESEKTKLERPVKWGGYLLSPDKFEFWQGRPGRLHDRIVYKKQEDKWIINRLAP